MVLLHVQGRTQAVCHALRRYTDATSEWTLDYPPLFAWFEWLLAQLARFADPAMLEVSRLNHASAATILFQVR